MLRSQVRSHTQLVTGPAADCPTGYGSQPGTHLLLCGPHHRSDRNRSGPFLHSSCTSMTGPTSLRPGCLPVSPHRHRRPRRQCRQEVGSNRRTASPNSGSSWSTRPASPLDPLMSPDRTVPGNRQGAPAAGRAIFAIKAPREMHRRFGEAVETVRRMHSPTSATAPGSRDGRVYTSQSEEPSLGPRSGVRASDLLLNSNGHHTSAWLQQAGTETITTHPGVPRQPQITRFRSADRCRARWSRHRALFLADAESDSSACLSAV